VNLPFICSNILAAPVYHIKSTSLLFDTKVVVRISISFLEVSANKKATASRIPSGKVEVIMTM
jgi:hypothetical protein